MNYSIFGNAFTGYHVIDSELQEVVDGVGPSFEECFLFVYGREPTHYECPPTKEELEDYDLNS